MNHLKNYNEKIRTDINKISFDNGSMILSEEWDRLYKESKGNSALQYAIAKCKNAPSHIVGAIIKDIDTSDLSKNDDFIDIKYITDTFFESLKHDIDEDALNIVTKYFSKNKYAELIKKMSSISQENSLSNNPFKEKNIEKLCLAMLKNKSARKDLLGTPYRFITNSDFADELLRNKKCDEGICTCIANNAFLPDNIRNRAFDMGVNYMNIYNPTKEMIDTMYLSCVESYFDVFHGDYKSRTSGGFNDLTASESKTYKNVVYNLAHLINRHLLTESQELDLINRFEFLYEKKKTDYILSILFSNTKHEEVIKKVNLFAKTRFTDAAYKNKNMPLKLRSWRIDEICKKLERTNGNVTCEEYFIVSSAIKDKILNHQQKEIIAKYLSKDVWLMNSLIKSGCQKMELVILQAGIDREIMRINKTYKKGYMFSGNYHRTRAITEILIQNNQLSNEKMLQSFIDATYCIHLSNDALKDEEKIKDAFRLIDFVKTINNSEYKKLLSILEDSAAIEYFDETKKYFEYLKDSLVLSKKLSKILDDKTYSEFSLNQLKYVLKENINDFFNKNENVIDFYNNIGEYSQKITPLIDEWNKKAVIEHDISI